MVSSRGLILGLGEIFTTPASLQHDDVEFPGCTDDEGRMIRRHTVPHSTATGLRYCGLPTPETAN